MKPPRLLLTLGLVLAASLPLLAQRPAPAAALPAGVPVVIGLQNPAAIRPLLDGTHELWKVDGVKKLMKAADVDPDKLREEFKQEMGFDYGELFDAMDGPSAIGVVPPTGHGEVDVIALIGVKDEAKAKEVWKKIQSRIESKMGDELVRSEETKVGGLDCWCIEGKAGEATRKAFFALHSGHFIATQSEKLLTETAAALQGKEVPVMAKRDEYTQALGRLGAARDLTVWVDFAVLKKEMQREMGSEGAKMMDVLGLDGIKALAFGAGLSNAGMDLSIHVHSPGARKGVMKLLSPNCGPQAPDHFAPADAVSAGLVYIDFPNLLGEIRKLAEAVEPGSAEEMDSGLGMLADQLGVDVQKDLLALMTPPLYFVEMPRQGDNDADSGKRTMMYFRSPNAKKLLGNMKTLLTAFQEQIGAEMKESDYVGNPIISLSSPMFGDEMAPAICATDTHFFISVGGSAAIERALRRAGKETPTVASSEAWKRATAGYPENSWMLGFSRVDAMVQNMLTALEPLAAMMDLPDELMHLDPKAVAKYVDLMGYSAASDASGLTLSLRATTPSKTAPK